MGELAIAFEATSAPTPGLEVGCPPSDALLAERARSGDQQAFAMLAQRYGQRVSRTIRRYGVEDCAIEDVTQLTFLAAWRALDGYDPTRSFATWVTAIGVNKARDWRRRQSSYGRKYVIAETDPLEVLLVTDPFSGPDALLDRIELRRVERALACLPDRLKTPLLLFTTTGLDQQQIADTLGVSLRTIETRIARARLQLVKLLEQWPAR